MILMKQDSLKYAWYALLTKSRFENLTGKSLIKKSFDVFFPQIRVKSKRRDRKLTLMAPLFPGYLFLKTDLHPDRHIEILKTPGAARLLGNSNGPVSIANDVVESLVIMLGTDAEVATGSIIKKGKMVMVIKGPFSGVTGRFVSYKGKGRVVVNIEVLGQSAEVEISRDDIEALPDIAL